MQFTAVGSTIANRHTPTSSYLFKRKYMFGNLEKALLHRYMCLVCVGNTHIMNKLHAMLTY